MEHDNISKLISNVLFITNRHLIFLVTGMSTSSARTTVQRSSKGAVAFASADITGGNIILENSSVGAKAKVSSGLFF